MRKLKIENQKKINYFFFINLIIKKLQLVVDGNIYKCISCRKINLTIIENDAINSGKRPIREYLKGT